MPRRYPATVRYAVPITISFVSQKGGVGKSALARTLGVTLGRAGMRVAVADLDHQQRTIVEWVRLRQAAGLEPRVPVRAFKTADDAIIAGGGADVLIVDGPARASADTLDSCQKLV